MGDRDRTRGGHVEHHGFPFPTIRRGLVVVVHLDDVFLPFHYCTPEVKPLVIWRSFASCPRCHCFTRVQVRLVVSFFFPVNKLLSFPLLANFSRPSLSSWKYLVVCSHSLWNSHHNFWLRQFMEILTGVGAGSMFMSLIVRKISRRLALNVGSFPVVSLASRTRPLVAVVIFCLALSFLGLNNGLLLSLSFRGLLPRVVDFTGIDE